MADRDKNPGFRVYKSGAAKRKEKSQKEESARILIRNIPTLDKFSFCASSFGETQSSLLFPHHMLTKLILIQYNWSSN